MTQETSTQAATQNDATSNSATTMDASQITEVLGQAEANTSKSRNPAATQPTTSKIAEQPQKEPTVISPKE